MKSLALWETHNLSRKLLKEIPFFHPFTNEEMDELLENNDYFNTVKKGTFIIREGTEYANDLYILIKGEVEITNNKNEHITYLSQGEVFGEIAFLTRTEHITNVIALDDVVVIQVDSEKIQDAKQEIQIRVKDGLVLTLASKLQKTNQALTEKDRANHELLDSVRRLSQELENNKGKKEPSSTPPEPQKHKPAPQKAQ
jgi:CRP-like cAMP-binding protein